MNNHYEDDQQKYGSTDPRCDKQADTKTWLMVLRNAWIQDKSLNSLYYLLHGIRCGGAELISTQNSFRLLPGEWTEKEWDAVKLDNLGLVRDRLISLLYRTRVKEDKTC